MTTESERDAISRMEQQIAEVLKSVNDLRERFAHMEGRAIDRTVETLRTELATAQARIAALEAADHIRNGQMQATRTWSEWTHRLAPWLFVVALVVWNFLQGAI